MENNTTTMFDRFKVARYTESGYAIFNVHHTAEYGVHADDAAYLHGMNLRAERLEIERIEDPLERQAELDKHERVCYAYVGWYSTKTVANGIIARINEDGTVDVSSQIPTCVCGGLKGERYLDRHCTSCNSDVRPRYVEKLSLHFERGYDESEDMLLEFAQIMRKKEQRELANFLANENWINEIQTPVLFYTDNSGYPVFSASGEDLILTARLNGLSKKAILHDTNPVDPYEDEGVKEYLRSYAEDGDAYVQAFRQGLDVTPEQLVKLAQDMKKKYPNEPVRSWRD